MHQSQLVKQVTFGRDKNNAINRYDKVVINHCSYLRTSTTNFQAPLSSSNNLYTMVTNMLVSEFTHAYVCGCTEVAMDDWHIFAAA